MPCDSIVTQRVEFTGAQNQIDLLMEAMKAQGYTVTKSGKGLRFSGHGFYGTYQNGSFTSQAGFDAKVDTIKKAFGEQVVKHVAKKYGWELKTKADGKMTIKKRR